MANTILHTADSRGTTNWGWLHSRHTFSFGDYYNQERINFGALRVINDDILAPERGFGNHPHSNMEIITILLEGELEHKDNMNNEVVISKGNIQVISAGTGIFHSEYNKNKEKPLRLLQIWVLPKIQGVVPRYEISSYELKEDDLTEILSPDLHNKKLWIFQDAWFSIGKADSGNPLTYILKNPKLNGVYIFVIKGNIEVNNQLLETKDGYGIWNVSQVTCKAVTDSEFLIIEVPMKI